MARYTDEFKQEAVKQVINNNYSIKDVAERLLPDLDMNELLLWSPDLFSYTSYLSNQSGIVVTKDFR